MAALGARLDVGQDAVLGGPFARLGRRHLPFLFLLVVVVVVLVVLLGVVVRGYLVQLVAHQHHYDVGLRDLPQVREPVRRVQEGRPPRYVEYEEGP